MRRFFFPIVALVIALSSCDDTTEGIGGSLVHSSDMLDIVTATYNVSTESVVADSVLSLSTLGYIGKVKDPETNAYITCNYMTQFHTLEGYELFPPDSMTFKGEDGKVYADSCEIIVSYNKFYGDSLALMKLTLHEMERPMEENKDFYSSFSPAKNGYLRTDGIHKSKSYTLADQSLNIGNDYVPYFKIPLNEPYTDKDGVTYNNYGTYIMQKYYSNPKSFASSYDFLHDVCPGFYIESSNGVGSMTYVYATQLNVHYKYNIKVKENKDSTIHYTSNFSGTEEVLQFTDVSQDAEQIKELASDGTCTYLKTPAGIFTRITIPVDEVMRDMSYPSSYKLRDDTLSTARMSLKCYNDETTSLYRLPAPSTLLVLVDTLKYDFFAEGKVADSRKSMLVSLSTNDKSYTFSNLSSIITTLAREKQAYISQHSGMTSEEYNLKFPNWNKLLLIPVKTNYATVGQQSMLTKVTHDMSLGSVRLVGGKNNKDTIQLSVIYSKFRNK